jgi:hypothetical protein
MRGTENALPRAVGALQGAARSPIALGLVN